jgi:ComF family protein
MGESCEACDSWPDGLTAASSGVVHRAPADALVRGLKYRGWTALAPRLARYMVDPLRRLTRGRRTILVPVPLSRKKLRARGFNQAELLARSLCDLTGTPWVDALSRGSGRMSQAGSGRRARTENVLGVFRWREGVRVDESLVILVDDVLTTGATAAACSVAIREAAREPGGVVTFSRVLDRVEETGLSE